MGNNRTFHQSIRSAPQQTADQSSRITAWLLSSPSTTVSVMVIRVIGFTLEQRNGCRRGEKEKKKRQLYTVVMQCVAGSHTHIFIHRSRVEELWPCRGVLLNLSRQFPPLLTNHTHIRKQTQIDGFLFVPQSELDPGSRLNLTLTTNSNRERKYCV